MKRLLISAVAVCALSMMTKAGDIPSVGAPQPQPTVASTTPGEIPSVPRTDQLTDSLILALLSGLDLVL
ncbi:MAG TPA: hypothetical protein VJT50_10945 [Pyrinomonadaceae bacterium]|nr:hypothetical protein [Pyrinomonadaceae bacterium]